MQAAKGTHHPNHPLRGIRDKMRIILIHLGTLGTATGGCVVSEMRFSPVVVRRSLLCTLETLQAKPDPAVRTLETIISLES